MKALNITLAVLLAVSIGLNLMLRKGTTTERWFEYFPDMARTVRYNAFEANPNFEDGLTLRVPPAGTIARGMLPLASDPSSMPDGTPVNPFSMDDAAARARGEVVYTTYCVPCHGTAGDGDGPVVQRGFPAPPTLLQGRAQSISDAEIFGAITNGAGTMPSYAAQIPREDRWKAVLHLRTLQNAAAPAGNAQ